MTPEELEQRIRAAGRAISLAGMVHEAVAAEVLGIAPRTLRAWRVDGRAPAHIRLNGTHWYAVSTLAAALG
jgi:predicted site-specific integrase-resolvase